ncbi:MAG: hypothetical protein ING29_19525 [Azospirillum sp.]|nr:hypothetical protein [Azospirillum sp.]
MRRAFVAFWLLVASPLAAQENPADFVAGFGRPGLPDAVRAAIAAHPGLAAAPKPAFATLAYDRIGASENRLDLKAHEGGITSIEQILGSVAGQAERDFAVALGGLLFLARTDEPRVPDLADRATWIALIESAEGALFPLAPGNALTVRYVLQEGWFFPGNRPNLAQRFGRWSVEERFEVAGPTDDCPGLDRKHGCAGFTIVTRCRADGRMVQNGRDIAAPPLWFCLPRAERHFSADLGWSWHPAIGNPRQVGAVGR